MKLQARSALGDLFGVATTVAEFGEDDQAATGRSAADRRAVRLSERAEIGCLMVNSAIDPSTAASEIAAAAGFGLPPAAGAITGAHLHRALWLTPRSWLLLCPVEEEEALAGRVNQAFPDKLVHAALFTDYLCWLELSGPPAFDLLAEGGFVSLERAGLAVGYAKRTGLAGVSVIILHESLQSWLIGIERSRAIYFAQWLRSKAFRGPR